MKLIVLILISYLIQGTIGDLQSMEPATTNIRHLPPNVGSNRSYVSPDALGKVGEHLSKVINSFLFDTIRSLQALLRNFEKFITNLANLTEPSMILPALSKIVNMVFAGIHTATRKLGQFVHGIIGTVDKALGGLNLSLNSLINSATNASSSSPRELSLAVDNSLRDIARSFTNLVTTSENTLKSIDNKSTAVPVMRSLLKATTVVLRDTLNKTAKGIEEVGHFVPVALSTAVDAVDKQIKDLNLTSPVDLNKIVADLQKCSIGTIVNVELVNKTLSGSTNNVDVVVSAISTSPPSDARWSSSLDELLTSVSRSFDEVISTAVSVTKATPVWREKIIPKINNVYSSVKNLIETAICMANENNVDLKGSLRNATLAVRSLLIALKSLTPAATKPNELVLNTLKSLELSVQSIITDVNDVFVALSIALKSHISETTILHSLIKKFDKALRGNTSGLYTLVPELESFCKNLK